MGLVADLPAEAGRRGHVARPDPDGVGDVRRQGGVAEPEQDRERDQAAPAGHAVEDAGTQPAEQEDHDVGRGHARTVRDVRRAPADLLLRARGQRHRGVTTGIVSQVRRKVRRGAPFHERRQRSPPWMRREREGQQMRGRIRIAAVGPSGHDAAVRCRPAAAPHRLARSLSFNQPPSRWLMSHSADRHRARPSGPPPFPLRSRGPARRRPQQHDDREGAVRPGSGRGGARPAAGTGAASCSGGRWRNPVPRRCGRDRR